VKIADEQSVLIETKKWEDPKGPIEISKPIERAGESLNSEIRRELRRGEGKMDRAK